MVPGVGLDTISGGDEVLDEPNLFIAAPVIARDEATFIASCGNGVQEATMGAAGPTVISTPGLIAERGKNRRWMWLTLFMHTIFYGLSVILIRLQVLCNATVCEWC